MCIFATFFSIITEETLLYGEHELTILLIKMIYHEKILIESVIYGLDGAVDNASTRLG